MKTKTKQFFYNNDFFIILYRKPSTSKTVKIGNLIIRESQFLPNIKLEFGTWTKKKLIIRCIKDIWEQTISCLWVTGMLSMAAQAPNWRSSLGEIT